jgi:tRNA modification GTPase
MEHLVQSGAREGRHGETLLGQGLFELEREILGQLIHARTQRAAEVLLVQLSGRLGAELREIASLCAPDEARRRTAKLRATYAYGRRLVEPATVVITGAPNVGKSTLANALVGRERSIVHHLPGTTRDAVSSVASLDGLPVVVVDTAGLREATDEIERIGVQKAIEKIGASEIAVWVFDHSRRVTAEELGYLKVLGKMAVVPVVNKIDLEGPLDERELGATVGSKVLRTCALTGRGIAELGKTVFGLLAPGEVPARDAAVVTTARVATALDEATARLEEGRAAGEVLEKLLEDRDEVR